MGTIGGLCQASATGLVAHGNKGGRDLLGLNNKRLAKPAGDKIKNPIHQTREQFEVAVQLPEIGMHSTKIRNPDVELF